MNVIEEIKVLEGFLGNRDRSICLERTIWETSPKKAAEQRTTYLELFFNNYYDELQKQVRRIV